MKIPGVHEPDPNHPEGMAFIFAAGVCDPRPGGYPKTLHPNQQWALKQCWEPTSRMFWDLGLRYHPELSTRWLEGGGQFALATVVNKPPVEKDMKELVADFAQDQFKQMKAEIDRVVESGTPEERERLLQRFRLAMENNKQVVALLEDAVANLPDELNADLHDKQGRPKKPRKGG